jgi:hypothetical protein
MRDTTQRSFDKAAKKILLASRNIGRTTPQDLRLIGEEILTDVKASAPGRGVPRDQGILAGSGMVEQPEPLVVEISFGGAAAPYALVQHERLDFQHKLGEARYLVRGLERWKPGGSAAMKGLKENAEAGIKAAAKS